MCLSLSLCVCVCVCVCLSLSMYVCLSLSLSLPLSLSLSLSLSPSLSLTPSSGNLYVSQARQKCRLESDELADDKVAISNVNYVYFHPTVIEHRLFWQLLCFNGISKEKTHVLLEENLCQYTFNRVLCQ